MVSTCRPRRASPMSASTTTAPAARRPSSWRAWSARPGRSVVLTHGYAYRAHAQRVSGFRDGLADYNPTIPIGSVVEGRDQQMQTEQMVLELLRTARRRGRRHLQYRRRQPGGRAGDHGGGPRQQDRASSATSCTVHSARTHARPAVMTLAIDQNPGAAGAEGDRRAASAASATPPAPAEPSDVPTRSSSPENIPPNPGRESRPEVFGAIRKDPESERAMSLISKGRGPLNSPTRPRTSAWAPAASTSSRCRAPPPEARQVRAFL